MEELAAIAFGYVYMKRKAKAKRRRFWVHPTLLRRSTEGAWALLMKEFCEKYPEKHKECMRVSVESFDHILGIIRPHIDKQDTKFRKAISSDQRLCVTLTFLATGDSFKTLANLFRMGQSTVRGIIYDTSQAIWVAMKDLYLKTPSTEEEWFHIAKGIVLRAMCDASYRFTYVDVGTSGRWSDGGTFDNCSLKHAMAAGNLNVPNDCPLTGTENPNMPFVLVGDEAFPLKNWLMRLYPGRSLDTFGKRIYNYRLSRARRTIENTFGIMVSRWRCLRRTLPMTAEHAQIVVLACCVLHNYMRTECCSSYTPPPGACDVIDNVAGTIVDGTWRAEGYGILGDVALATARNPTLSATTTREHFTNYFSTAGALEWQERYIRRTN
ncbi:uncharacterized protein [Watersipora subatra]|uniref:uncharacterized protein n=1 Tax=Watersipora subatra TaxID=2589382 RepID=UPI00355BDC0E